NCLLLNRQAADVIVIALQRCAALGQEVFPLPSVECNSDGLLSPTSTQRSHQQERGDCFHRGVASYPGRAYVCKGGTRKLRQPRAVVLITVRLFLFSRRFW